MKTKLTFDEWKKAVKEQVWARSEYTEGDMLKCDFLDFMYRNGVGRTSAASAVLEQMKTVPEKSITLGEIEALAEKYSLSATHTTQPNAIGEPDGPCKGYDHEELAKFVDDLKKPFSIGKDFLLISYMDMGDASVSTTELHWVTLTRVPYGRKLELSCGKTILCRFKVDEKGETSERVRVEFLEKMVWHCNKRFHSDSEGLQHDASCDKLTSKLPDDLNSYDYVKYTKVLEGLKARRQNDQRGM